MGNKSKQGSSSGKTTTQKSSSYSSVNTDSRSFTTIDSKKYSKSDSRSHTNIDSKNMSKNLSNIDNKIIANVAIKCGVNTNDIDNYTNDKSINMKQDNSQNLVATGDGNSIKNIIQKMNLNSYGPEITECMQKSLIQLSQDNKIKLVSDSNNETIAATKSTNKTKLVGANKIAVDNSVATIQKSAQKSTNKQTTSQKNSADQVSGLMSGNFNLDLDYETIFIVLAIVTFVFILLFILLKFYNKE